MLVDLGIRVTWLARTGWMQSGIPPSMAETVSQHTFLASLIALDLMKELKRRGKTFSENKVLKMVLIHDIAEGVVGDLPKWTGDRVNKSKLEEEALSMEVTQADLLDLWREYSEGRRMEAKIARLADLMATWRMSIYYKELGFPVDDIMRSTERESLKLAEELGLVIEGGES
ncbi:MAG: HD domain-containing protein [Candidatus Korarchaeota archaeon]|nr:HD domain-containing protein [Candidatus Korarchaeota archaeon]